MSDEGLADTLEEDICDRGMSRCPDTARMRSAMLVSSGVQARSSLTRKSCSSDFFNNPYSVYYQGTYGQWGQMKTTRRRSPPASSSSLHQLEQLRLLAHSRGTEPGSSARPLPQPLMSSRPLPTTQVKDYAPCDHSSSEFDEVFQVEIQKWLKEIRETCFEHCKKIDYENISHVLAQQLKEIQSSSSKDEMSDKRQEMFVAIRECLDNVLDKTNIHMPFRERNRWTDKLLCKIFVIVDRFPNDSEITAKRSQSDIIWDWVSEIPYISFNGISDKRRMFDQLNNKLNNIQGKIIEQTEKQDAMMDIIDGWLVNVFNQNYRTSLEINSQRRQKLVLQLISNILSLGNHHGIESGTDVCNTQTHTSRNQKIINTEFNKTIQLTLENKKNSGKLFSGLNTNSVLGKGNICYSVSNFAFNRDLSPASSYEHVSKEIPEYLMIEIKEMIANTLGVGEADPSEYEKVKQEIQDLLISEVKLPPDEAFKVADNIVKQVRVKVFEVAAEEDELIQFIKDSIAKELADFFVDETEMEPLKQYLPDVITNFMKGPISEDEREETLGNIQDKGGLSRNAAEALLQRMAGEAKKMNSYASVHKSLNRIKSGQGTKPNISLKDQTNFEKKAKRIISEFIYDHLDDPSEEKEAKIKTLVHNAVDNLVDTLTDNTKSEEDKRKAMGKTIGKYLHWASLDTDEPIETLAEELVNRLNNLPRKSIGEKKYFIDNSRKIENKIRSWLDRLPLISDDWRDTEWKDTVIKDLTTTIVDRQMKLQNQPEAKLTDKKEKEYIKKQCHEWLEKYFDDDDLAIASNKIEDLVNSLLGVNNASKNHVKLNGVKSWIKKQPMKPIIDSKKANDIVQDLTDKFNELRGTPNGEKKIREEIRNILPLLYGDLDDKELQRLESSMFKSIVPTDQRLEVKNAVNSWVQSQPFKPIVDSKEVTDIVNDLSDKLNELKGKPDSEKLMREQIRKVLPLLYGDLDEEEIKSLESSLFQYLAPKLKSPIVENEIEAWVRRQSIKPMVGAEKVKYITSNLSDRLEALKGKPNAEKRMREEIRKALPLLYGDLDENELKQLESSLFHSLGPENMSPKIKENISSWVQRQSLKPIVGTQAVKDITNTLTDKLQALKGKPNAEKLMRDEIRKMLPLLYGDLDEEELKRLESSLFQSLAPQIRQPAIEDEINSWVQRQSAKPVVGPKEVKSIIKDLKDQLNTLKGKPNAEKLMRAQIRKMLPLLYGDLDEEVLKKLESSLFHSLAPQIRPPAIEDEINSWVQRQSLKPIVGTEAVKDITNTLTDKLQALKGKPNAEKLMRDEIRKMLPLLYGDLDEEELKRLESSLFQSLAPQIRPPAIEDEINSWVQRQSAKPVVGPKEVKSIIKELKDQLNTFKGKPNAEKHMRAKIRKMLPLLYGDLNEEELNRLESSLFQSLAPTLLSPKNETFSSDQRKPLQPIVDTQTGNEIIGDLIERLLALQDQPNAEKLMRKEIRKVVPTLYGDLDEEDIKRLESYLFRTLAPEITFPIIEDKDLSPPPVKTLANVIDEWVNSLPIEVKSREQQQKVQNAKEKLLERLRLIRAHIPPSSPLYEQGVIEESKKAMREIISDPYKKSDDDYLNQKAKKLFEKVISIPIGTDEILQDRKLKSPIDKLYDFVKDWCNNLPLDKDKEKSETMKQDLSSKLINKIGELNMNPEIFNDESLYLDILQDEVQQLLSEVPYNSELHKYLPAMEKQFISTVMEIRAKLLKELGGKAYKLQLKDTIQNTLPIPHNLSLEEQTSLERLKDEVADAFINMNFSGDGTEKCRYKRKISEEIDKFCDSILRHCPCANLDTTKMKIDLNNALFKVPIPRDDSMKSEIEQVRIRDIIYTWMKEIPLRQETSPEKLHRYKLAAVLAKHLHDIEVEKESNPYWNADPELDEEITKFIKKLPIRYDLMDKIPQLVVSLMNALKNTEQKRKFISVRRSRSAETQSNIRAQSPCNSTVNDRSHFMRICKRIGIDGVKDASTCCPTHSCCQTESPPLTSVCKPQSFKQIHSKDIDNSLPPQKENSICSRGCFTPCAPPSCSFGTQTICPPFTRSPCARVSPSPILSCTKQRFQKLNPCGNIKEQCQNFSPCPRSAPTCSFTPNCCRTTPNCCSVPNSYPISSPRSSIPMSCTAGTPISCGRPQQSPISSQGVYTFPPGSPCCQSTPCEDSRPRHISPRIIVKEYFCNTTDPSRSQDKHQEISQCEQSSGSVLPQRQRQGPMNSYAQEECLMCTNLRPSDKYTLRSEDPAYSCDTCSYMDSTDETTDVDNIFSGPSTSWRYSNNYYSPRHNKINCNARNRTPRSPSTTEVEWNFSDDDGFFAGRGCIPSGVQKRSQCRNKERIASRYTDHGDNYCETWHKYAKQQQYLYYE